MTVIDRCETTYDFAVWKIGQKSSLPYYYYFIGNLPVSTIFLRFLLSSFIGFLFRAQDYYYYYYNYVVPFYYVARGCVSTTILQVCAIYYLYLHNMFEQEMSDDDNKNIKKERNILFMDVVTCYRLYTCDRTILKFSFRSIIILQSVYLYLQVKLIKFLAND